MVELLKEENIIKENIGMGYKRYIFVNTFGLSEDLEIESNIDEVIFHVVGLILSLFLERIMKEEITLCLPIYILTF